MEPAGCHTLLRMFRWRTLWRSTFHNRMVLSEEQDRKDPGGSCPSHPPLPPPSVYTCFQDNKHLQHKQHDLFKMFVTKRGGGGGPRGPTHTRSGRAPSRASPSCGGPEHPKRKDCGRCKRTTASDWWGQRSLPRRLGTAPPLCRRTADWRRKNMLTDLHRPDSEL